MKTCPFCGTRVEESVVQCPVCKSWAGSPAVFPAGEADSGAGKWSVYEPEERDLAARFRLKWLCALTALTLSMIFFVFPDRYRSEVPSRLGIVFLFLGSAWFLPLFTGKRPEPVAVSEQGIAAWGWAGSPGDPWPGPRCGP